MPDREKVIKGLKMCIRHGENPSVRCGQKDECPYEQNGLPCWIDLSRDALALLKEQEIVPYIDIDEAKCPDCKVKLTRQELLGEDVLFEDFYDYCPRCGKKVKWK